MSGPSLFFVSRDALSQQQFDLLITREHELERKRREDRVGIQCPPEPASEESGQENA
jgi:hypothetical protein